MFEKYEKQKSLSISNRSWSNILSFEWYEDFMYNENACIMQSLSDFENGDEDSFEWINRRLADIIQWTKYGQLRNGYRYDKMVIVKEEDISFWVLIYIMEESEITPVKQM